MLPFAPSLDRVFASTDTLRVYFEAFTRAADTHLIPSVEIVDAGGRVVRSPSPSFASGDPIRVQASIPLNDLPPGAYLLRATLGSGPSKASREAGFAIR